MANLFRSWTFVCYPESAPADWIKQLNDRHLQFAVSPLHDADLNADDSEKKPHWHVFVTYPGKKSYDQVLEISKGICNGTIPQSVDNPIGLIRYFIHLDNPEKYQYSRDDIRVFGGLDIDDYFKVSKLAQLQVVCEIIKYSKCRNIWYYSDLVDDLIVNDQYQWLFYVMCSNTLALQAYFNGARNKRKDLSEAKQ